MHQAAEVLHHNLLRERVLSEQVQGEAVRGPPLPGNRGPGVQPEAEKAAARDRLGARHGVRTHVLGAAAARVRVARGPLRDLLGDTSGTFCSQALSGSLLQPQSPSLLAVLGGPLTLSPATLNADLRAAPCTLASGPCVCFPLLRAPTRPPPSPAGCPHCPLLAHRPSMLPSCRDTCCPVHLIHA